MAITKILARHGGLKDSINYVLNGEKTDEKILTAFQNCTSSHAYNRMMKTKEKFHKKDGIISYHMIQSFAPGEVSPTLALEIAKQFAREHLDGYEAVIGVHVDKAHVHVHTIFNSVSCKTGEKYHSNAKSYYCQIRATSDRLCAEHGLSVIMQGERGNGISYAEWLRLKNNQPTLRSMLMADLDKAISQSADYGHFLMNMEHMGYEVKLGYRLSFRLRGTQKYYVPQRKNMKYSETEIRDSIANGLADPMSRPPQKRYALFKPTGKLKGFWGLYLCLLGKIQKQEYPPHITPTQKQATLQFEKYKEKFALLNEYKIETAEQLKTHIATLQQKQAQFSKQRVILNSRKKRKKQLFDAVADTEALLPAKELYEEGMTGMEAEYIKYLQSAKLVENSGIPPQTIKQEKAELYNALADIHSELRKLKKEQKLCEEILYEAPTLQSQLEKTNEIEVKKDVKRKRRR
ncbi:MAG: relaxase/mobilization nuclease domain-containing protein [Christensenellaceae bacterium]